MGILGAILEYARSWPVQLYHIGVLQYYKLQNLDSYHIYETLKKTIHHWWFAKRYWLACRIAPFPLYVATKEHYQVQYLQNGVLYTLKWKRPKRGPRDLIFVFDQHGKEITSDLRTFMGPNNDFHQLPISPALLGHSTLRLQRGPEYQQEYRNSEYFFLHN